MLQKCNIPVALSSDICYNGNHKAIMPAFERALVMTHDELEAMSDGLSVEMSDSDIDALEDEGYTVRAVRNLDEGKKYVGVIDSTDYPCELYKDYRCDTLRMTAHGRATFTS